MRKFKDIKRSRRDDLMRQINELKNNPKVGIDFNHLVNLKNWARAKELFEAKK